MSMKYIEEKSRSGISHKKFTSDFGMRIMSQLGWKEGEGLGKKGTGIKDVIQVKRRDENVGLGKEAKQEDWSDKWWENSYNNILKNIKTKKVSIVDEDISEDETEPDKREEKEIITKKPKREKKEKEVRLLGRKRKITFLSI